MINRELKCTDTQSTAKKKLPTCFDHNFLKSTNSTSIQVSPDSSRRDLNRGAKRFLFSVNFVVDLSRTSCPVSPEGILTHFSFCASIQISARAVRGYLDRGRIRRFQGLMIETSWQRTKRTSVGGNPPFVPFPSPCRLRFLVAFVARGCPFSPFNL